MAYVFLTPEDSHYTAANSNTHIFGTNGDQIVYIYPGAENVYLDQNVEGVELDGDISNYEFKQSGNVLDIYSSDGTFISSVPIQMDDNGSQIEFKDGNSYEAKLNLSGEYMGRITIGDYVVDNTNPSPVTPGGGGGGTSPSFHEIDLTGINTYQGTSDPDKFVLNVVNAMQDQAGTNTQVTIQNFDINQDYLDLIMQNANSNIKTLSDLDGYSGIHVDYSAFNNYTIVDFGNDQNGGEPVIVTLVGITPDEWGDVHVDVVS